MIIGQLLSDLTNHNTKRNETKRNERETKRNKNTNFSDTTNSNMKTMTTITVQEFNKERMRKFVQVVQNEQNVDACDDFFSPKFYNPDLAVLLNTGSCAEKESYQDDHVEGDKVLHRLLFKAFPDMKVTILDIAADGDKVWTYKMFEGTHSGPWMDIQPTNEKVSFPVIDIMTMDENGMILDHANVSTFVSTIDKLREIQQNQQQKKEGEEKHEG